MPDPVIVVLTARPRSRILHDGGSGDWRLDPARARRAAYLVCTQNRHSPDRIETAFGPPGAPHGAAFLIGRITAIVPSGENRWMIRIGEYSEPEVPIPNIWARSGHLRYPVWYTTLEELGIDLGALPRFQPIPTSHPTGFAEATGRLLLPAEPAKSAAPPAPQPGSPDAWHRLEAILAQLDRVPDLPTPADPLAWDEHGVPR